MNLTAQGPITREALSRRVRDMAANPTRRFKGVVSLNTSDQQWRRHCQVNGSRRLVLVEREKFRARFRTVPVDKLRYGVIVRALGAL